MEPLPTTVEALRELTRMGDESFAHELLRISGRVEKIVPEIVGLSLSLLSDDTLTFTLTATTGPVAELDGMQYLAGGPCDDTLRTGESHIYRAGDPVDEDRWLLFAQATAAAGVRSTLSLPITDSAVVVAGVNLYAGTTHAFEGRVEALAAACGSWPAGAVTNADLAFTSRFEAARAPGRLRAEATIDRAVGVLMSRWQVSSTHARERLRDAAHRAGISDAQMAQAVLQLLLPPGAAPEHP